MSEWRVKKGKTSIQDIPIYDKYGVLVQNLADANTIRFQVKTDVDVASPSISKSEGDGITVDAPASGYLQVKISPSDTASLEIGLYVMALEIDWGGDLEYEAVIKIDGAKTTEFRIDHGIIS